MAHRPQEVFSAETPVQCGTAQEGQPSKGPAPCGSEGAQSPVIQKWDRPGLVYLIHMFIFAVQKRIMQSNRCCLSYCLLIPKPSLSSEHIRAHMRKQEPIHFLLLLEKGLYTSNSPSHYIFFQPSKRKYNAIA